MSGLLPTLCLSWFRFQCLALGPWRRGQCSSLIFYVAQKTSVIAVFIWPFWALFQSTGQMGERTKGRCSRRGQWVDPPTGSAVCCSMCPPASQNMGGECFLEPWLWLYKQSALVRRIRKRIFCLQHRVLVYPQPWHVSGGSEEEGKNVPKYVHLAVIWGKGCS